MELWIMLAVYAIACVLIIIMVRHSGGTGFYDGRSSSDNIHPPFDDGGVDDYDDGCDCGDGCDCDDGCDCGCNDD